MTRRRSRHHPAAVIALGTGVLVAADMAMWLLWVLWHLLPFLAATAATVAAYRAGQRHLSGGGQ